MNWKAFGCNSAWWVAQAHAAWRFERALRNPTEAQAGVLQRILRQNRRSAFGREHDFATLSSVRDFQDRVALSSYEDYEPWLARVRFGEPGVLTASPVTRLVPTSGSSGAAKLIPYTAGLHRQFAAALAP